MTIEQIASSTKINVRLLHALESDYYVDLPAQPFVRGFVASYCRFLNIDTNEVFTRYGSFIEKKCSERPSKDGGHSGYAFEKRDTDRSRAILWVTMGSFVVFGGLAFLLLRPSEKPSKIANVEKLRAAHEQKKETQAQKFPEPVTVEASPPPKVEPSKKEDAVSEVAQVEVKEASPPATPQVSSDDPKKKDPLHKGDALREGAVRHKVVFKALSDTWVRYKVDSRPVMRFVLRKDLLLVLKAEDRVHFQVSDPQHVSLRYQSEEYVPLNEVPNVTDTQNSTPTVIFPYELAEGAKDPFEGMRRLPRQLQIN